MASMLPVDPIVNDIQHETPRPRSPRFRTHAFGVPPSFPGLSRVCRPLSLHAAPVPSNPCLPRPGEPEPGIGGAQAGPLVEQGKLTIPRGGNGRHDPDRMHRKIRGAVDP